MGDPSIAPPPDPGGDPWISLLWVLGLLVINAFFVAVEFSLVSVRRSRIAQLANDNHRQAKLVQRAQDHLERSLSTTQLGITLASLLLGWIGATQVAGVVRQGLVAIPLLQPLGSDLLQRLALLLSFVGITYLQVVWGELLPKAVAIGRPEPTALGLAWLNELIGQLLKPLIELPRASAKFILRRLGIPIPNASSLYGSMTAEELQILLSTEGSNAIEAEERELLSNVFEFGETVASEVMIPRTAIAAVPRSATVKDLLLLVGESGHTRYPVYGESLDNIHGLLDIKELVSGLANGILTMDSPISDFVRPAHFEHENKLISELLPQMQQQRLAMVVVVDEFGGTAGLVTIKDLVEEIVGTLADGPGQADAEPDVQQLDEQAFLFQAQMEVQEVSEVLGFELPLHDDYQTLGGFLIYQMQKIPAEGETLIFQDWEFRVMRVDGPRLDRIQVCHLTKTSDPPEMLDPLSPEPTGSL